MFHPLKDFLPQALKRSGAERSVTAAMIVEAARPILLQIVPQLRPADFEVVSYNQGCLTVAVASPAAAQELKMRDEAILEALRETLGQNQIRRLKFVPLIEQEDEFW